MISTIFLIYLSFLLISAQKFKSIEKAVESIQQNQARLSSIDLSGLELTLEDVHKIEHSLQANEFLGFIEWPFDASNIKQEKLFHPINRIHNKLKMNNLKFRRYPTDFTHLILTIHANSEESDEKNEMRVMFNDEKHIDLNRYVWEWEVKQVFSKHAKLYQNQFSKQLVLVYKSLDKNDPSLKTRFKNFTSSQIKETFKATKESIELAKKETNYISFSGYSYGAFLAELSLLFANFEFDHKDSRAVGFESPGASQIFNYYSKRHNLKREETELDLTNYVSSLVNLSRHSGKLYHIKNVEANHKNLFFNNDLTYLIDSFNLDTFRPNELNQLIVSDLDNLNNLDLENETFETLLSLPQVQQLISQIELNLDLAKIDISQLKYEKVDYYSEVLRPDLSLIDKCLVRIFELSEADFRNDLFKEYLAEFKRFYFVNGNFLEYSMVTNYGYSVDEVKEFVGRVLMVSKDLRHLLSRVAKKNLKMRKLLSKYPDEAKLFVERNELIESMRNIFYSAQILVLHSPEMNGKTSLANFYTQKSLLDYGLVWWFDGKLLDFEFRSFANLCLRLQTWSLDKNGLIQKVKSVFAKFSFKVLFVFDGVDSFQALEEYIIDLPYNFKILITTRDRNLAQVFEKSALAVNGLSSKEANEFFKNYLPDTFLGSDDVKLLYETETGETRIHKAPADLNSIITHLKIDKTLAISDFTKNGKIVNNLEIFDSISRNSHTKLLLLEYLSFLSDEVWVDLISDLFQMSKKDLKLEIEYLVEADLITVFEFNHLFFVKLNNIYRDYLRKNSKSNEILNSLMKTLDKYFLSDFFHAENLRNAKLAYPNLKLILNQNFEILKRNVFFKKVLKKMSKYETLVNLDYAEAMKYEEVLLEETNLESVSDSLFSIGQLSKKKHDFKNSIINLEKSLDFFDNLNGRLNNLKKAEILKELGLVLMSLGENQKALTHFTNSLEISKQLKNEVLCGELLINVCLTYLTLEDMKNALNYFNASILTFEKTQKNPTKKELLLNILIIVNFFILNEEYKKGIEYFANTFEMFKLLDGKSFEKSELVLNLGHFLIDFNHFKTWKKNEFFTFLNFDANVKNVVALNNLALVNLMNRNYEKSIELSEKSLDVLKSAPKTHANRKNLFFTYKILGMSYENSSFGLLSALNCFLHSLGLSIKLFSLNDQWIRNSLNDLFRLYMKSFGYQVFILIAFGYLRMRYGSNKARLFILALFLMLTLIFYAFYYDY